MTWHHMHGHPMQHQQLKSQLMKQRPMKSCRMLPDTYNIVWNNAIPLQRAQCNDARCNDDRYNDARCNDNRCNADPWNTAQYNTAQWKASQCKTTPCNTILQQAPDKSADKGTGGDQNLCSIFHILKIRMTARQIPSSMTEMNTAHIQNKAKQYHC